MEASEAWRSYLQQVQGDHLELDPKFLSRDSYGGAEQRWGTLGGTLVSLSPASVDLEDVAAQVGGKEQAANLMASARADYSLTFRNLAANDGQWLALFGAGNAEAQYALATFYKEGTGVAKDEVQSVRLLQAAALASQANAQDCGLNTTASSKNSSRATRSSDQRELCFYFPASSGGRKNHLTSNPVRASRMQNSLIARSFSAGSAISAVYSAMKSLRFR